MDMSVQLNQYFPNDILRFFGLTPKNVVPYIEKCPLCTSPDTFIVDHDYAGGMWYRCTAAHCGFVGGIIELTAKLRGISVPAAIRHLIELLNDFTLKRMCTDEAIAQYQFTDLGRAKIQAFWERCRDMQLWARDSFIARYLQDTMGVWGDHQRWGEQIGQYIGTALRRELVDLLGAKPVDAAMPVNTRNRLLLLWPWEDIPGRLHTLEAHFPGRQASYYLHLGPGDAAEGGLMFLRHVAPGEPTVFAIGDALIAMRMQQRHFAMYNRPGPLVGWRSSSSQAWQYVRPKTIVLWAPKLNADVLRQAKRIGHALVAWWDVDVTSLCGEEQSTVQYFMEQLKARARPWHDVLRDYLAHATHSDACEMIAGLYLSAADWDILLDVDEPVIRSRVGQYYVSGEVPRITTLNGVRVIARNGKWYISRVKGRQVMDDDLLTDAPFQIITVINHAPSNTIYLYGEVSHKGKSLTFQATEAELREDAPGYFRQLLTRHGIGFPTFTGPAYQRNFLVDLALTFRSPEIISDAGRVGWDAAGDRYVLPNVVITKSDIRTGPTTRTTPDALPACRVTHAADDDAKSWFRRNMLHAAMWAIVVGVLRNACHRMLGIKPRALGVIGSPGTVGGEALAAVARQFNLLDFRLHTLEAVREYNAQSDEHDLPALVRPDPFTMGPFNAWLQDASDKNALVLMSMRQAAACAMQPGWDFVVCPQIENTHLPQSMPGLLPRLLQAMMAWPADQQEDTGLLAIFDFVRRWVAAQRFAETVDHRFVLDTAHSYLRCGHPLGPLLMDEKLLCLTTRLLDDGVIKHATKASTRSVVSTLPGGDIVVYVSRLVEALRRADLPAPVSASDWTGDTALTADGGWQVTQQQVEACRLRWAPSSVIGNHSGLQPGA